MVEDALVAFLYPYYFIASLGMKQYGMESHWVHCYMVVGGFCEDKRTGKGLLGDEGRTHQWPESDQQH